VFLYEDESASINELTPAITEEIASENAIELWSEVSENYGDLDDYLEEYRAGTMTAEAKRIYEALLTHGPLDTVRPRREARMSAESAKSRFERALVELQVELKVLPIGVAEAGAWRYAFVYDIVQRHFPELPEQARHIKRSEARCTLVSRYLDNMVAADRKMISKVFHVLKWTLTELDRTIATLLEEDAVWEMQVRGLKHPQLLSSQVLREFQKNNRPKASFANSTTEA